MLINLFRYNSGYRCKLCKLEEQCDRCHNIDKTTKYNLYETYIVSLRDELDLIPEDTKLLFFNNNSNEITWKDLLKLPTKIEVLDLGFTNIIHIGIGRDYVSTNKNIKNEHKYIQLLYDVIGRLLNLKLIIISKKYSRITAKHIERVCQLLNTDLYIEEILI